MSKSASRAQVPDLIPLVTLRASAAAGQRSDHRPTSFEHRRSHSETHRSSAFSDSNVAEKSHHTSRLADVKPRYLNQSRRPASLLGTTTTTTIHKTPSTLSVKSMKNHSSSDSSRNSSPALRRQIPKPKTKLTHESSNMSRDSLASPAKQNKCNYLNNNKAITDFDISIDSLGDSLHSSMKTDKTQSHESLVRANRTESTIKSKLSNGSRLKPAMKCPTINANKSTTTSTTQNSPSSVATSTKSGGGRLSSVTSAVSSPRDLYNGRRSISIPAAVPQQKSFLSAKSREILAAKRQTLNHAESTKSVPGSVNKSKMNVVNKSSSTTCVPAITAAAKRPISFPTTLHLRRSAKLNANPVAPVVVPPSNKNKIIRNAKSIVGQKQPNKLEIFENQSTESPSSSPQPPPQKPMRIESKLERSSTFCKETSEIPMGELQIIE